MYSIRTFRRPIRKAIVFICFLVLGSCSIPFAQPRFAADIDKFLKADSINFPPANAIVFTGSSSFTKWTDVRDYFPGYPIINRGFGGSILPDVIRYANKIIIPYKPKQVVIYCGDNDLASSDTVTAQIVLDRFKELFFIIRNQLPNTNVVFVSIKPSPSRERLLTKVQAANTLVKNFLATQKNTGFADVYHPMLGPDNLPVKDLFLDDMLHMKPNGYVIWQKVIQPYLLK